MIYKSKLADLKFNLGTLVDIKAKTGKDALTFIGEDKDVADHIELVRAIYEAGAMRAGGVVPDGFYDLEIQDLTDIMAAFIKAYSVPGEVNPDTQSGKAVTY